MTLLTGAALSCAHAQAGGTQNDMPPQDAQQPPQEQHIIASPNPTIDDSRPTVAPGNVSSAKVEPASATTAAPMKSAAKPKRKRRSRQ